MQKSFFLFESCGQLRGRVSRPFLQLPYEREALRSCIVYEPLQGRHWVRPMVMLLRRLALTLSPQPFPFVAELFRFGTSFCGFGTLVKYLPLMVYVFFFLRLYTYIFACI